MYILFFFYHVQQEIISRFVKSLHPQFIKAVITSFVTDIGFSFSFRIDSDINSNSNSSLGGPVAGAVRES